MYKEAKQNLHANHCEAKENSDASLRIVESSERERDYHKIKFCTSLSCTRTQGMRYPTENKQNKLTLYSNL